VRKQRFFGRDFYLSVDTKEQEVKGYRLVAEGELRTVKPFDVTVEKKEPLRAELESFLQCVHDRRRPLVTGEDGLEAVALAARVAAAIDESMRKGRA
jgi:predicted dehydrogenase